MDNVAVDNALSPAQKEARLFSPEVMLKMARLGAPLISADGSQVLYTINHQSVADNKGYTSIWVQPLVDQGDTPHPAHRLTGNNIGANSPVWGPADPQTGRQPVYFLSSKSGSSQLWRVQTDGRGLQKMSDIAGGIDGFGISPDGRKIWYAAQVKVEPVTGAERYGDRAAKSQVRIYDDLMERHWDTWEDGAYSHIRQGGLQQ